MKKNLIFNRVKIEFESNSKNVWLIIIYLFKKLNYGRLLLLLEVEMKNELKLTLTLLALPAEFPPEMAN